MGAPAITTPRPARKPRPATRPRPAAKPRTAPKRRPAAAKPRTAPRARANARTAPARTNHRASSSGFALRPVAAVGRTAVAVGGIADSGFVVGMTRSRVWIGVLGVLLGGIVAVNVWGLGLSAGSSATAAKIDELQQENGVLRGRAALQNSNDRIAAAAAELGLQVPAADGVNYLDYDANAAERAAERLANGKIAVAPPTAPATAEEEAAALEADAAAAEAAVVDPATVAPVDPATTTVAPVDPATTAIDPNTGLPLTP